MIRLLGSLSGIICLIILFFNFFSYFLQDIYFKINNKKIRKFINLILPIFSKNKKYYISACFIFFIVHLSCFFINLNNFIICSFLIILSIITINFKYHIFSKAILDLLKKVFSYLIIIFIIFHIFF